MTYPSSHPSARPSRSYPPQSVLAARRRIDVLGIVCGVLGAAGVGTAFGVALVACGSTTPSLQGAALGNSLRVHGASESLAAAAGPGEPGGVRNAKTSLSSAVVTKASENPVFPSLEFAANVQQPQALGLFASSGADTNVCPRNMAAVGRFCIDRYEASLVEVLPGGLERPFPYTQNPGSVSVRAISEPHVFPQAYISGREAAQACGASGKRLCKADEWRSACRGSSQSTYPYGQTRQAGTCNDHGRAPLGVVYKGDSKVYGSWDKMNDPALNQVEGSLARSGEHEACASEAGVMDMVGNLHEWIDDPRGTFLGGYYLDTEQNGSGCGYTTDRHGTFYHDYSTGFRCCADRP